MTATMKTRSLTMAALMTAVLCLLGPASLPIGPVPVSLTNLAIYFICYVLDVKKTCAAYCTYMLIGLAGLPVFSGYAGGPQKLFGPTGGYIIGFLPMALVTAWFVGQHHKNRVLCILVMEAATWLAYIPGTLWLAASMHMSFAAAFSAGVLPFLVLDFMKIVAAALVGPVLRSRLHAAGLLG